MRHNAYVPFLDMV